MNPETQSNSSDITPGFAGLRVVAFESRMAAEVATMIERRGGVAIIAPSMREVPLEDNHAALDFAISSIRSPAFRAMGQIASHSSRTPSQLRCGTLCFNRVRRTWIRRFE
jgi:hypothetical protein